MADEKLVTREERIQEEQRMAAREALKAGERKADETVEGGRYKVGDEMVDAEGKPVKKGKKDGGD